VVHDGNLGFSFRDVVLIDTDGVGPESSRFIGEPQALKSRVEVLADAERVSIDLYRSRWGRRPPSVRETGVTAGGVESRRLDVELEGTTIILAGMQGDQSDLLPAGL
jgi:hypothetical protein